MTIEELKQFQQEHGYTFERFAELSGVPEETIQAVFEGKRKGVTYEELQALENLFEDCQSVREEAVSYGNTIGKYTIDDYYALPDERRVELIDGWFYDMASPTSIHQDIAGEIYYQIRDFIKKNQGKCKVYMAPLDVRLDCDNKTMVQPDVLIFCDSDQRKKWGIMGAPDFVLEVISPSTRKKDYVIKANKYLKAGVREYWILDPYQKTLVRYLFEKDETVLLSGLEESVDIGIYGGKLKIDFREILQEIETFEALAE